MKSDAIRALSNRGQRLATASPMPEYLLEHFTRSEDRWHATDNPDGYVALCVAENKAVSDLVLPWLSRAHEAPTSVLGYDAMVGSHAFREQLSGFFEKTFLGRRFAPEHIAVLAGAGTILEQVFYALADKGEGVLVPTPSYAGFWMDLETRDELRIVPVPCESADGFRLTTERLDAALASAPCPVKALLFTNPDNPLGRVATRDEVIAIADWAEAKGIHVVFDEIYALSVFGDVPFTSVAATRANLGDHVHIVWAFSKDFGASGLRCGVLVSENEALLRSVDGLAYWGAASGHTQWLLGEMIADADFVARFPEVLRARLGERYARVTAALSDAGIDFLPAGGAIFVLCDLRASLPESTWDGERALWMRCLDEANVNLTPGAACRIAEPGFLRLCYMAEPLEAVLAGIERLGRIR